MTAAALLVVLGAAFAMEIGGLSMAMGAFLAGVLLSESSFRNQLEADIEPFRGLLLGLFFLGVGMSLDLNLIAAAWRSVIGLVVVFVTVKALGIYVAARIFNTRRRDSLRLALLLAEGGEFAFVLYAAAVGAGILSPETTATAYGRRHRLDGVDAARAAAPALSPAAAAAFPRWRRGTGRSNRDGTRHRLRTFRPGSEPGAACPRHRRYHHRRQC